LNFIEVFDQLLTGILVITWEGILKIETSKKDLIQEESDFVLEMRQ
jgi:hypothetical protein